MGVCQRRQVGTYAWLRKIANQQAAHNCDAGHDKEVEQGFHPYPPYRLAITIACDRADHAREYKGYDNHLHHLDENIADGLQKAADYPSFVLGKEIEKCPHYNPEHKTCNNSSHQTSLRHTSSSYYNLDCTLAGKNAKHIVGTCYFY